MLKNKKLVLKWSSAQEHVGKKTMDRTKGLSGRALEKGLIIAEGNARYSGAVSEEERNINCEIHNIMVVGIKQGDSTTGVVHVINSHKDNFISLHRTKEVLGRLVSYLGLVIHSTHRLAVRKFNI